MLNAWPPFHVFRYSNILTKAGHIMEFVIQTRDLCKKYGKFNALTDLSINIPKGAIYGMVGRNGAGKTTLIRILTGLNNPTSGEYSIFGVKNTDKKLHEVKRKMGAVVETPSLHPEMSARDNLIQQNKALGIGNDNVDGILRLVGLANTGKKKAKDFSLGMRQRLGIAFSLVGDPDFLVLDEPINGLDPQGIMEVREMILRLNKEKGITILISSHILDELSKLATNYGFIDKGRIVEEISAEELEKKCRKVTKLKVSDEKALIILLDEIGFDYEVEADGHINVFGKINVTKLVTKLASSGCELLSVNESDESLENYYINLVGSGEKD